MVKIMMVMAHTLPLPLRVTYCLTLLKLPLTITLNKVTALQQGLNLPNSVA